jgi:hypothetical protein
MTCVQHYRQVGVIHNENRVVGLCANPYFASFGSLSISSVASFQHHKLQETCYGRAHAEKHTIVEINPTFEPLRGLLILILTAFFKMTPLALATKAKDIRLQDAAQRDLTPAKVGSCWKCSGTNATGHVNN